ncbi:MAG: aminotransferase class V-fold PLP-dependent enzyme [Gemmatimonadota bacterium]
MLRCQADEFSLPEGVHYLNGAYMSPLLRSVEEAGIAAIRRKRFPVDITPVDFFDPADAARERFARLVGATDPERVAILPAVSYGVAVAARNTPLAAGQNIVLVEGQFPSNALIWHRRARERGATVRTVPAPDRALEAIDADTAVLAMAPLHWTDGTRFDLTALGHRAREVGAVFVVDGTQAVGAQPIDVAAVGVDALIVAAYKWLLGPYSLAFGWFGSRFDGGTPLEEAWLARTGSDDFRSLVHYVDEYRPAAPPARILPAPAPYRFTVPTLAPDPMGLHKLRAVWNRVRDSLSPCGAPRSGSRPTCTTPRTTSSPSAPPSSKPPGRRPDPRFGPPDRPARRRGSRGLRKRMAV